jgi:aspartate kinase
MQAGLIVQKYGGTSVGSIERIQAVAQRVAHTVEQGKRVVVVVSAMGEETDRLVELGEQILQGSPTTPAQWREWDMLLSTGEQVSIALLALALQRLGYPALSLTAAQVGIVTTRDHGRAPHSAHPHRPPLATPRAGRGGGGGRLSGHHQPN